MRADGCPNLVNRPEMNIAILTLETFGGVVKSLEPLPREFNPAPLTFETYLLELATCQDTLLSHSCNYRRGTPRPVYVRVPSVGIVARQS